MEPPVQAGHVAPGGTEKATGPVAAGVKVAVVREVATTPLVIARTGWSRVIWMIASAVCRAPAALRVWLRAWLVNSRPSAKGLSETVTVNRTSATLGAGG